MLGTWEKAPQRSLNAALVAKSHQLSSASTVAKDHAGPVAKRHAGPVAELVDGIGSVMRLFRPRKLFLATQKTSCNKCSFNITAKSWNEKFFTWV